MTPIAVRIEVSEFLPAEVTVGARMHIAAWVFPPTGPPAAHPDPLFLVSVFSTSARTYVLVRVRLWLVTLLLDVLGYPWVWSV